VIMAMWQSAADDDDNNITTTATVPATKRATRR
jgi:hypothetical protein